MISELYFLNLSKKEWNDLSNILIERGGLGNSVSNILNQIKSFKIDENSEESELIQFYRFIENMGLPLLGYGTQRAVFQIDNDHVLKIAVTNLGIKANKKEANPQIQGYLRNFIPKVYTSDSEGSWLIMDKVTPVGEHMQNPYLPMREWFQAIGFPTFERWDLIKSILRLIYFYVVNKKMSMNDALNRAFKEYDWLEEERKEFLSSPIFMALSRSINESDPSLIKILGDLHAGNIGWTEDGNPVIIDWG